MQDGSFGKFAPDRLHRNPAHDAVPIFHSKEIEIHAGDGTLQGMTAKSGIILMSERQRMLDSTQSFLAAVTRIAELATLAVDSAKGTGPLPATPARRRPLSKPLMDGSHGVSTSASRSRSDSASLAGTFKLRPYILPYCRKGGRSLGRAGTAAFPLIAVIISDWRTRWLPVQSSQKKALPHRVIRRPQNIQKRRRRSAALIWCVLTLV